MTAGWIPQGPEVLATPGWARSPLLDVERTELDVTVTLGGLTFHGRRTPAPPRGWAHHVSSLDGWWDSSPDKTQTLDHWSGDGVVSLLSRAGARLVEVSGYIRAAQRPAPMMLHAMEDLEVRSAEGGLLVVDEHLSGRRLEAEVSRVDLKFSRFAAWSTAFSLILRADDPLKFSQRTMLLANGTNAVGSAGNSAVNPVLDLVGPHGALTITHPGGVYTFAALAAGQRRTLDWRNGDVWNGNVRVFGVEGGRRPIVVKGGSSWTVAGLGSGTATLRRFEAWK